MSIEIPPFKIANLLRELFGRTVDFDTSTPPDLSSPAPRWAAVYATPDGTITAVCICDLSFAAFAGAALSMIPASTAKEGIKNQKLEPVIVDNLHEVFNIFGQLFRDRIMDTVTLREVGPVGELSARSQGLVAKPGKQVDLMFSIEGYGDGKLSLFS